MNNIITYTVIKNTNNDLYLTVQNGEVIIKAPWYYTNTKIQEVIEEKKNWILNKINEYKLQEEKKYIRNEVVQLLGEECKVIINYKNLKKPTLTLEDKDIKICLPNKYKKLNREEILIRLIEKLYDLVAKQEIESIMEKIRIKLGFAPEDYKFERMNDKIIKCNKEQSIITINPDIVKYSKEKIEFLLIHEFCHLKYKTHSKKFNELLSKNIEKFK